MSFAFHNVYFKTDLGDVHLVSVPSAICLLRPECQIVANTEYTFPKHLGVRITTISHGRRLYTLQAIHARLIAREKRTTRKKILHTHTLRSPYRTTISISGHGPKVFRIIVVSTKVTRIPNGRTDSLSILTLATLHDRPYVYKHLAGICQNLPKTAPLNISPPAACPPPILGHYCLTIISILDVWSNVFLGYLR